VIGGPGNLKQLGLLEGQNLLAWFKAFNRNNVAARESGPSVEAASTLARIFQECLFVEGMPFAIDSSDFNSDIYR
jgi:hypothetical protein